ncbi:MAG TPA: DNA-directed RNA polymerase subunit L [Methanotrichaceae archaeon]|nr:DNA-directed RNA polymerase subunit L [Methanotrichaceae archaeon]
MNLKIIKKTDDEVLIEFEGESHTMLNLLRTELLRDDRVQIANYDNKFVIMTNPIFRLKTRDVDPMDAIKDAAARIVALCDEFSTQFQTAIK